MLTFVPGSFGMALFRLICIRNHFESLNKMTLAKRIILAEILFLGSSVFILPYMVQNHMEDVPVYGRCLNIDSSFIEVIKAYKNFEDYRLARAVRFGIVLVCQVSKDCFVACCMIDIILCHIILCRVYSLESSSSTLGFCTFVTLVTVTTSKVESSPGTLKRRGMRRTL